MYGSFLVEDVFGDDHGVGAAHTGECRVLDLGAVLADVFGVSGGELRVALIADASDRALVTLRRAHHGQYRAGGADLDAPSAFEVLGIGSEFLGDRAHLRVLHAI
ncbi:hypothetical protein [Streptomyces poriticola]|uniref:hypothetical protein n=1 Tax=Streptomyces poriticola TaxID=3120506 RepID=UPI002FCE15E6